jgi:GT2 family glycosyltransferase
LWWAGATNLGVQWALDHGAAFVMLLNNDCYLPPEAIDGLMSHAAETPNAVIAPVQRDYRTRETLVSYAGTLFLLGFPTLVPFGSRSIDTTVRRLIPTKIILGGRGVVIPAAVFRSVGLFNDIELPHYGADHDFYLRCRKANIPLFIAAACSIFVDSERTTLAGNSDGMGYKGLVRALSDRRSHRNIRDLSALFRLHYPIKPLYFVGVTLNVSRFLLIILWHRIRRLFS